MAVETNGLYRHGGRLAEAMRVFPHAPSPWIDLSTGVNPIPWTGEEDADDGRLPDPDAIVALEAAAAASFGVAADHIAAVPGTELAIRLMPSVIRAALIGIVSPTYGSHEQAWSARGGVVRPLSRDGMNIGGLHAVVLANPNNPDGGVLSRDSILDLAGRMERENGWLIVDEAFADATPAISVADRACGRLIVLRSFGKFFGRPGLRLGFVVAAPEVLARLRELVGEWPVSVQATIVGRAAYTDTAWQLATRARLQEDVARMDGILTEAGFAVAGGVSLFRLAVHDDAGGRFRRLAEQGILTRPFADHPAWLRFGLPKSQDWARVESAVRALS